MCVVCLVCVICCDVRCVCACVRACVRACVCVCVQFCVLGEKQNNEKIICPNQTVQRKKAFCAKHYELEQPI